MNKKGQITIFIILGIILLIAIALVIIFREEITVFTPERVIPPEIAPIVLYSDECLEQIATDGVHLLGAQGGYIYLPPQIENNPLAYVDTGLKIPKWQYITENRIPPVPLMEAHLSRYVEENLNDCLNDFLPFQQEYNIIEQGEIEAETTIANDWVIFEIDYPLEIRDIEGTKITDFSEYEATLPIRLGQVHEVAKEIMEREAEEARVEKITIDLIALDPDIPLSGFEMTCNQLTWRVSEVEEKLKTLLRTNLPSIRIEQTDYLPVPSDQPYVQNHYIWQVTELNYPDIKATLQFNENRPLLMSVSPRSGDLLKSGMQKSQDVASFFCMQMWKFTYSVEYPVVVTVEDEENNFALNYAFKVKVRKNRASRDTLGQAPETFAEFGATAEAYCAEENRYGDYTMRILTYDNVTDPLFGQVAPFPINDVNVSFTCLKFTCEMGKTEYEQGGAAAVLETDFPYCAGGILRGRKEGYKETEAFVTTRDNQEVRLYLTPVKIFDDYSVVKHALVNGQLQAAEALESGETVFISLKYVDNETVLQATNGAYPAPELRELELLAGADFPYQVEIYLMDGENIAGGYIGEWTPQWSNLEDAGEIEFHVVDTGVPETDEAAIGLMNDIQIYSEQINPILR